MARHRAAELPAVQAATELGSPEPASTNSTAATYEPAPKVSPSLGSQATPAATTTPTGPPKSPPSSPNSSPPSPLLLQHRRLHFQTDRASVRRWAIAHKLAPDTRYKAPPKPVKRWQARDHGALWQHDATPHPFLPGSPAKQCLLDLLDAATRYNTGARLYESETLLAHLDFLSRAFQAHGLPLMLYVDYHSFFFTHTPDAYTQLGTALHLYDVALRYAPTPQAKGKVERRHDYWQKRLLPLLAADQILELEGANLHLDNSSPTPTNTKSSANWA